MNSARNSSLINNNKKWIRNSREPKSNDELHYDELREIAQEGSNRYCFDCHQRGPTYVNMTIGSFVCMRCSGLLRGLTPPHRVKSMSMTTFTSEEMDSLRERGNDYSKQVWLALFEGNVLTESSDEQEIKDFMIQKYERKRYYVDPKVSGVQLRSNTTNSSSSSAENLHAGNGTNGEDEFLKNWKSIPSANNGVQQSNGYSKAILRDRNQIRSNNNGTPSITPPRITTTNGTADFVADFSKADIFVAETPKPPSLNGNNNNVNNNTQTSFANFDNNPIFNASTQKPPIQSKLTSQLTSPPSEDRYAALKDLDNALKTQQQYNDTVQQQQQAVADWVNSSPNQFNTMSPQSSVSSFGSPMFEQQFNNVNNKESVWNPFSAGTSPYPNNTWGLSPKDYNPNPFKQFGNGLNTQPVISNGNNGAYAMQLNGFYNNRQGGFTSNGTTSQNGFAESITVNPFKVGGVSSGQATAVSSNPFL